MTMQRRRKVAKKAVVRKVAKKAEGTDIARIADGATIPARTLCLRVRHERRSPR